jgi:prophage regulatory protein
VAMAQRFLTLADVAEELAVSVAQVRVLVRSGELRAIQVGGRNQWRVESSALEEYIQEQYARTRARIEAEQRS